MNENCSRAFERSKYLRKAAMRRILRFSHISVSGKLWNCDVNNTPSLPLRDKRHAMFAVAFPAPPPMGGYSLLINRIFIGSSWLSHGGRKIRTGFGARNKNLYIGKCQRDGRFILA